MVPGDIGDLPTDGAPKGCATDKAPAPKRHPVRRCLSAAFDAVTAILAAVILWLDELIYPDRR
jgi:hypothetical protein